MKQMPGNTQNPKMKDILEKTGYIGGIMVEIHYPG
jgi:hypothetical protein